MLYIYLVVGPWGKQHRRVLYMCLVVGPQRQAPWQSSMYQSWTAGLYRNARLYMSHMVDLYIYTHVAQVKSLYIKIMPVQSVFIKITNRPRGYT